MTKAADAINDFLKKLKKDRRKIVLKNCTGTSQQYAGKKSEIE